MTIKMQPVVDASGNSKHHIFDAHGAASAADLAKARENFERAIVEGADKSRAVVERVLTEIPEDAIVRGSALEFGYSSARLGSGRLGMLSGNHEWTLHSHARGQVAERVGIPMAYFNALDQADVVTTHADGSIEVSESNAWRRELLARNLNELFAHGNGRRFLIRSIDGEARGFLSDKFRRLDSRPLLDSFLAGASTAGAVPYEATASDVRWAVKAMIPRVHEPVPGELLAFGLEARNSDFGSGQYEISGFVLRLRCLNAALQASQLKQVHLGRRLPDDLVFSAQTYELDTKAMLSASQDMVRMLVGPEGVERALATVRRAHEQETDFAKAFAAVSKALTKAEAEDVKRSFEGDDVEALPAGKTAYRFSNAISWLAHKAEPERQLELEKLAGAVLERAAA